MANLGFRTLMRPKKPLIVIDARMIGPFGHGIAEYVRDLILGLEEVPNRPYNFHILVGRNLPQSDPMRKVAHTQVLAAFLSPSELIEVPLKVKKLGADLFHSPSFSAFPFVCGPSIYTVHDLTHLYFGSVLKKTYYRVILKPTLRRASKLTTVSEFSQKELSDWLGWPKDRIKVIRNAIHLDELPLDWEKMLSKWNLRKRAYHFALSNSKPHKNISLLLRAYLAHVKKNPHAWPLVLSVDRKEVGVEHSKVICVGALGTDEKNALLAGAAAFYFPSITEGFGRPPIEAYLLKCPRIVVSDIPVHRELMSGLDNPPLFLSPHREEEWTAQFSQAEGPVEFLVGGLSSSTKKKTWLSRQELAEQMDKVYREALNLPD